MLPLQTFEEAAIELNDMVQELRYSDGSPIVDSGGLRAPAGGSYQDVYEYDPIFPNTQIVNTTPEMTQEEINALKKRREENIGIRNTHIEAYRLVVQCLRGFKLKPRKANYGSYALKHLIERIHEDGVRHIGIPSGIAMIAAFKMEFVTKKELIAAAKKGLHVYLHISPKEVKQFDHQTST